MLECIYSMFQWSLFPLLSKGLLVKLFDMGIYWVRLKSTHRACRSVICDRCFQPTSSFVEHGTTPKHDMIILGLFLLSLQGRKSSFQLPMLCRSRHAFDFPVDLLHLSSPHPPVTSRVHGRQDYAVDGYDATEVCCACGSGTIEASNVPYSSQDGDAKRETTSAQDRWSPGGLRKLVTGE